MNYSAKSVTKKSGELALDASNIADGYFFAKVASPIPQRLKLRITKGSYTATFDLNNKGKFEMFPLQAGNGSYQIVLYKNVYSNKYAAAGTILLNVALKRPNAGFLVPNQYINYHEIPELIELTKEKCQGQTKTENYNIIKKFIKTNFIYDFIKAISIKKGMLPDIKGLLKKKAGICLDLAGLAVAMLRICNIPAKLVIGMADNHYHAWVEIINDNGKIIRYDPTADINGISKVNKYIPERYY